MGGKYFFDRIPPQERARLAKECGLTEEEARVFEERAKTDSVIAVSMRLSMSDRTVKRRSASIARKIARCAHHDCTRANPGERACNS